MATINISSFFTRSFLDEYFIHFIKNTFEGKSVHTVNVLPDIQYVINVVSKTNTGKKIYEEPANTHTHYFQTIKEMADLLLSLPLIKV